MERRDFLRLNAALSLAIPTLAVPSLAIFAGCSRTQQNGGAPVAEAAESAVEPTVEPAEPAADSAAELAESAIDQPSEVTIEEGIGSEIKQAYIKDHLDLNIPPNDLEPIVVAGDEFALAKSLSARLGRVVKHIGHGNFNVLSLDQMRSVAKSAGAIGAFPREEMELFEKLFFRDAKEYGFFGEKVSSAMTAAFNQKEIVKVPYTGHFLYKGKAVEVYESVKKDIGDTIFLTSGVRGVPKQMHLFLAKTFECGGNFSEASRSLAPAGYSYHGIGDFDVGKVGFGERNFTQDFAKTREYEKLMELRYIAIRYPRGNPYGVYYEPWHIEVVGNA